MATKALRRDRVQRLASMRWDELRVRIGQEVGKRWDVVRYRLGMPVSGKGVHSLPAISGHFFFEAHDLPSRVALLQERVPQEADQIVEQAAHICQHRFDLLGYRDVRYGQEIDWHLDAVNGKEAPRKPWFQIPFLDFDSVGDVKITWELNRHQHLVTLGKAYCLTRNEAFAEELLRQWYHWHQENPYPIGINWASSLEVAFRSLSWLWVRHLLAGWPGLPDRFQSDLLRGLALGGRHLERYLSIYFSPNTHLLGEGVALFFIGTLCRQLPTAPRWQRLGWQIVLSESERPVQPDGMHFEQSVYYHVYALDFFLHARLLAERNQIPISASLDQTLEKMLEILCVLGQAGAPPRLGDDDGGRLFNPRRNRAEHLLDPLATGAVMFNRPDFKSVAGGLREETLWLLGPKGAEEFDQILRAPALRSSIGFESSGIYVMAGSEPAARQLVIDAGPLGTGRAGHGHADALSVHLSLGGHECLADPGTFSYVGDSAKRSLFRGTAAHNTLQVDRCDQAESSGPFAWRSLPVVRNEYWVTGENFDLFVGSHEGYCRLSPPVLHRRSVFHLKSRFWLVHDLALGTGTHRLDLFWHLAPEWLDSSAHGGAVVFSLAGEQTQALALVPAEGNGWSQEIIQEWFSPAYGRKRASLVLHFETQANLPVEFVTLLLPLREPVAELGRLRRMDEGTGEAPVKVYLYTVGQEHHYMFFADRSQPWQWGTWSSDARFAYWSVSLESGARQCVLCEASYLDIGGQRVISCARRLARIEWLSSSKAGPIFCSDEASLSQVHEEALSLAGLIEQGEAVTFRERIC